MKKTKFYPIVAFFLWFAHIVNLYIWLKLDVNYLTYDSHRHFLLSLKIFEEFKKFSPEAFFHCIDLTQRHPPLVMMISAPFYFIFGSSQDAGVLISSTIFLAVLIFAVYKLGERILSPKAGLLAAFIVTMYPVIFNQIKVYMLDLPLTAIVSLSVYFLICSDNFKIMRYNLLLFLSLTLGMLIKASFAIFLAFPLIFTFVNFFFKRRLKQISGSRVVSEIQDPVLPKKKFNTIILFFILFILIVLLIFCFTYYLSPTVFIASVGDGPFLKKITSFLRIFTQGPGFLQTWPTAAPDGYFIRRLHALVWYLWGFINWQVSFSFFIVFIISLFFFIKYRFDYKKLFLAWPIGALFLLVNAGYGIGINMEVSAVRYSMPLLPAIAIISAVGIKRIATYKFRNYLIRAIIIFGFAQLLFVSYPLLNGLGKVQIPINFNGKYNFFPESIVFFDPGAWAVSGSDSGSHPRDFKAEALVCEKILNIIGNSSGKKENIMITVIPDDTRLWYLQYLVFTQNRPFNIACDWNYYWIENRKCGNSAGIILSSDYVVDKEGSWQAEAYMLPVVLDRRRYFELYRDRFILLDELTWPDGAKIRIYKRIRF